jgi:hypothetical protein
LLSMAKGQRTLLPSRGGRKNHKKPLRMTEI